MKRRFTLAVSSLLVGVPVHLAWGIPGLATSDSANVTSLTIAVASLVIFAYKIARHKIFYTKYRFQLRLIANILMMNFVLKYAIPRFSLTAKISNQLADFVRVYIIDLGRWTATWTSCADIMTLLCAVALLDYALRTTLLVEDATHFYNTLQIGYEHDKSCRQPCCEYANKLKIRAQNSLTKDPVCEREEPANFSWQPELGPRRRYWDY